MARLILLYLQTEAVRSNNPEVELGRSMHAWLARMGIPAGGKNYKLVSEQARRISACRLTFLLWRRSLRRRSQRDGLTWDRIARLANDWLPKPRILHPWPSTRFAVTHPR
jgi:RNA-directed DNA polymerase